MFGLVAPVSIIIASTWGSVVAFSNKSPHYKNNTVRPSSNVQGNTNTDRVNVRPSSSNVEGNTNKDRVNNNNVRPSSNVRGNNNNGRKPFVIGGDKKTFDPDTQPKS